MEYNILKYVYFLLGFKYSEENLVKFKLKKIFLEYKNILFLVYLNKEVSEEIRDKLFKVIFNYKKNNFFIFEVLVNIIVKIIECEGVFVLVLNIKINEVIEFFILIKVGEYLEVKR